jgi:hypothetical protein
MDVYDCSRRELIPHGETGGLVIFEDIPNYWDAWGALRSLHVEFCAFPFTHEQLLLLDVEIHHLEKAAATQVFERQGRRVWAPPCVCGDRCRVWEEQDHDDSKHHPSSRFPPANRHWLLDLA